jgi:hypothetical protein
VVHLGVVFSRLLQTIKLQRDAFVWMDFNDRATGDAAILVALTQVLLALGTGTGLLTLLNPINLVNVLISGAFFWLIYSGATYAIVRFIFDGHGSFAFYLRVTGFAYPTLLLIIFANIFLDNYLLILVAGAALFVVIVANGISYIADLSTDKSFISAIGGYVVITILQAILSGIRFF